MAGHQLQVVALGGVGDAAAGEKHPPQEGGAAAVLLQQAEIDVEHRVLPGIEAEGIDDPRQLPRLRNLENVLLLILAGQAVKGHSEGPVQQFGQPLGKALALCDHPDLSGGEGIAVEQRAVELRPGAAAPAHGGPAQLALHFP